MFIFFERKVQSHTNTQKTRTEYDITVHNVHNRLRPYSVIQFYVRLKNCLGWILGCDECHED